MQLPSLNQLHTGLTLALALSLGALVAENSRLSDREQTSKVAVSERDMRISTLTQQLTDTKQRADDLERSSHVVTQVLRKPDGTVQETRTVDTRVSDRSNSTESTAVSTAEHIESTTAKQSVTETSSKPSLSRYSVEAWRAGLALPEYGGAVGARLGDLPVWLQLGWLQGTGPLLGLRGEF
jgi:TolA-binding protein